MDGSADILTLSLDGPEGGKSIHPAILLSDGGCEKILVDCGYPGSLQKIASALSRHGIPFEEITGVVVTHHDYDHCGALGEIKEKFPHIAAWSSEFDAPYIEGRAKSLRIEQTTSALATLTERERAEAERFIAELEAVRPAGIDRTLRDGDVMPWCGGTEIIATPGHMPGHISLYVPALRTVITGDALTATRGKLRITNPLYATDASSAKRSARKLLNLDAEKYICYHGGVVLRKIIV
jgi:glyoxylase-like metal-dependent hydrolase (beta-lactamase superfamily II)